MLALDKRAIGVFDSGLGGLTAVKELMRILPEESIVYFGDTGRVPYGTKSEDTIVKYTMGDIEFLRTFDLKAIIIACGTASTIALSKVKDKYDVPIIGVVEAACRAATTKTKNKKIGIIGTPGTIKSGMYERFIKAIDGDIFTVSAACPLFVPLVEEGWTDNEVSRMTAKEYLEPIKAAGVDTLILGCTHYPLLEKTIAEFMGDDVTLINPGAETAREVKKWLGDKDMLSDSAEDEQYRFFSSDSVESFTCLGSRFLERKIDGKVQRVDIEQYTRGQ